MIRYKLQELIEKKEFNERRRVTIKEVASRTGINRMTLSKILHHRGYSTTTKNIDRLCHYFNCSVPQLLEFISENESGDGVRTEHQVNQKQALLHF